VPRKSVACARRQRHGDDGRRGGTRDALPREAATRPLRISAGDRPAGREGVDPRRRGAGLPEVRGPAVLHGPHLADRLELRGLEGPLKLPIVRSGGAKPAPPPQPPSLPPPPPRPAPPPA